jgi:hypothetical protein
MVGRPVCRGGKEGVFKEHDAWKTMRWGRAVKMEGEDRVEEVVIKQGSGRPATRSSTGKEQ